jgi:hypothetical protein
METVITVENSRKTYHPKGRKGVEVKALDGISFIVARGEFFGLLGPNGAAYPWFKARWSASRFFSRGLVCESSKAGPSTKAFFVTLSQHFRHLLRGQLLA